MLSLALSFIQPTFDIMDQGASPATVQQLTPNSSPSDEQNQPSAGGARTLASCDLCRRRKVKCDKGKPCSNCLRARVACVSSTIPRLTRARKVGRRKIDGEILKRIAKLENLVKYLETENDEIVSATPAANSEDARPTSEMVNPVEAGERDLKSLESVKKSPKDNLDRYLSSSFWVTLSDEISGLREVLNDSSDDDIESEDTKRMSPESIPVPMQGGSPSFAIFGSSTFGSTAVVLEHPHLPQVHMLCSIYLRNVDCVFKVLHAPSLKRYLHGQAKHLDGSPGPMGLEALKFAIYYAATTAFTAEQCMRQMGEERSVLLTRYRSSIELALARANFVNTVELSTLQALVVFLVSVRSNDPTRFAWTVLSLTIRIATALGLHREESFASLRPFDKEMHRRLWWQIFVLDEQAAQDRGSDPIITKNSYNTRKPSHVDDDDLNPEDVEEPKEKDYFTDMTFSLISHEVSETMIELNFVPAGEPELAQHDIARAWERRRDFVIRAQHRIRDKYLRYCDLAIPFHCVTKRIADIIMAQLWLILYRPLQKRAEYSTSFQPTNPNILHLSVEVMEKAYHVSTDSAADGIRWLASNYSLWHPLSVTLAELCVQTEGPMVERAWTIVDAMFTKTEETVADSSTGMLWTPIKKLARRARSARQHRLHILSAGPVAGHLDEKGTLPMSMHDEASSITDREPVAMDGQLATVPQQYFSSSPTGTFDWNTLFQGSGPGLELDLTDTNQVAWSNWQGFVDDLYGPGVVMEGQEYGLPAPSNSWFPQP